MIRKSTTDSDEILVTAYRAGDDQAMGVLFDRYAHLVVGVALKYLKDKEAAKDAAVDIFESLFTKLKSHDVTSFRPWLYTLTRNHCLQMLRKESRGPKWVNGTHKEPQADRFSLELKQAQEQRLEALEQCLVELNEDQAKCIRAFYLEKRSYRQIAAALGMELKSVKSHVQNGKRNLKIALEKRDEFK